MIALQVYMSFWRGYGKRFLQEFHIRQKSEFYILNKDSLFWMDDLFYAVNKSSPDNPLKNENPEDHLKSLRTKLACLFPFTQVFRSFLEAKIMMLLSMDKKENKNLLTSYKSYLAVAHLASFDIRDLPPKKRGNIFDDALLFVEKYIKDKQSQIKRKKGCDKNVRSRVGDFFKNFGVSQAERGLHELFKDKFERRNISMNISAQTLKK